jgi:hypothetical protein
MRLGALGNRDEDRSALVLDEEDDEFRLRGRAGIAANDVHVVRAFVKDLTGIEGDWRPSLDLHDDRAFQDVDERMRVVAMDWVRGPGSIFHRQHRPFLAFDPSQIAREKRRYLCFGGLRRSDSGQAEERARQQDTVHRDFLFLVSPFDRQSKRSCVNLEDWTRETRADLTAVARPDRSWGPRAGNRDSVQGLAARRDQAMEPWKAVSAARSPDWD